MIKFTEDKTKDSDFRVLGEKPRAGTGERVPRRRPPRHGWRKTLLLIPVLAVLAAGTILILRGRRAYAPIPDVPTVFEPAPEPDTIPEEDITEAVKPLSEDRDTTGTAYTEHIQKTVNDILLDIYIPHNARAELMIGTPDISDKDIVFAAQAADIRADNGKIVGAFVAKGEPLSFGLSKRGYCGIIGDRIEVGVADNSPLFEEATEKEGYFFRQYPLVDGGALVENEQKGKSVRKALCQRSGETFIVFTDTPESFHDFSQALVDLGVDNAIYLVGSEYSYGFTRDLVGEAEQFAERRSRRWKYENYLVWRR